MNAKIGHAHIIIGTHYYEESSEGGSGVEVNKSERQPKLRIG
jgi:hypothetical protein